MSTSWQIFKANATPHDGLTELPLPPPWRRSSVAEKPEKPANPSYDLEAEKNRGAHIKVKEEVRLAVNSALALRRPLLVTGNPGVGKSSLISAVAYELRMGPVLRWPITSRSTVKAGLYEYDAVGRLHARQNEEDASVGQFIKLGPLGTALYPSKWPRALLIDEIDKGDIDLPNDLLNVLEEGTFDIPELVRARDKEPEVRLADGQRARIPGGEVKCAQFPFIVLTSNAEREFPAPFLRRCIRITVPQPNPVELGEIVQVQLAKYLDKDTQAEIDKLIADFVGRRETQQLATDQLLNAVFLVLGDGRAVLQEARQETINLLLKQLTTSQST